MKNQYSFRLTTTLLPTDTTAKVTQVINKVDSEGNKFYPTFTEETVVITNDDRTIMETTRAVCTNGAITFTKRGLADDSSEEQIENRKLSRNPGSLCFITAWAWDMIDKDEDNIWTWKQTYTGDLESRWSATYKGLLTTEKWVVYPHFPNVEALNAYTQPFGWMFAVVDSTWELYRYNAVTESWDVITTSEPSNPEMADEDTIWTVRVATQAEFNAGTDTGSQWEKLVATPSMIKGAIPLATDETIWLTRRATTAEIRNWDNEWEDWATLFISPRQFQNEWKKMSLVRTIVNQSSQSSSTRWATLTKSYETTRNWFLTVEWIEETNGGSVDTHFEVEGADYRYWPSVATDEISRCLVNIWWTNYYPNIRIKRTAILAVRIWTITANLYIDDNANLSSPVYVRIVDFFYFE